MIVEIVQISVLQRKAKTLLNYVFIYFSVSILFYRLFIIPFSRCKDTEKKSNNKKYLAIKPVSLIVILKNIYFPYTILRINIHFSIIIQDPLACQYCIIGEP